MEEPVEGPGPETGAGPVPERDGGPAVVWGLTLFHAETGTEGGHWAVQDVRGIDAGRSGEPGSWSYHGLLLLRTGDRLTVYEPASVSARDPKEPRPILGWDARVRWDGEVRLRSYPVFTEQALGLWIHSDQIGVPREEWARLFFRSLPCRLVTRRPPWPLVSTGIPAENRHGIAWEHDQLLLMSDGGVRWSARGTSAHQDEPPYELRLVVHSEQRRRSVRPQKTPEAD